MSKNQGLSFFEKYLSVWVVLCIAVGVFIGLFFPAFPKFLSKLEYAHVSLPIAVLIWLMIFPMMLKIDFGGVVSSVKQPKGLTVTIVTNWLVKPLSMYFLTWLFFKVVFHSIIDDNTAKQYIAGAVLLGAAPCTAMVFVWSYLTKGNPSYTLVQVAINDLIILVAYAPIVSFLLGLNHVPVPFLTLILSVVIFVLIPLSAGVFVRRRVIAKKGQKFFNDVFLSKFSGITVTGLLLTLVIIFSYQGKTILSKPLNIVLIAVPLILQTFLIFFFAYLWARIWKIPHEIAAPAGLIGASNFFELAVAVAISLFGLNSGATLTTVVGVLVEVPVMLVLVKIANKTRHLYPVQVKEVLDENGMD